MALTLHLEIFRHNPSDPESKPRMQHFEMEETASMTLFLVLSQIRETMDATLQFDFCCRAGICGSCPGCWTKATLTIPVPKENCDQ